MLRRRFVDDSLERHIWSIDKFDGNFLNLYCFRCVNVWIIDVSLLLPWRFVDVSLKIPWRFSEVFDASNNDFKVFFDLNSKTLMLPCCFIIGSLMILWRDIFETLIISMETFLICIVSSVLTSESFMFHCFFIDDSLMNL